MKLKALLSIRRIRSPLFEIVCQDHLVGLVQARRHEETVRSLQATAHMIELAVHYVSPTSSGQQMKSLLG